MFGGNPAALNAVKLIEVHPVAVTASLYSGFENALVRAARRGSAFVRTGNDRADW